jgi:crotonobetainyl-CoA:carnitine CoA-transferase CaiB-like acyl-CoA transferase
VLSALRHRERTGLGQYVDIAMLDSMISMTDVVTSLWSLGERPDEGPNGIMASFKASDGYFAMQVVREKQFEALATLIGAPEWIGDERFSTRVGWGRNTETVIRPKLEAWAAAQTRIEVCDLLGGANIPAGPVFTAPEVIDDPHVAARDMLVEMDRTDDGPDPVLIPGNPVKLSRMTEGPETRVPWVGEHTDEVLSAELGLDESALADLRADGVIN